MKKADIRVLIYKLDENGEPHEGPDRPEAIIEIKTGRLSRIRSGNLTQMLHHAILAKASLDPAVKKVSSVAWPILDGTEI